MPALSVILSAHGIDARAVRAVQSVLEQPSVDLELIVVCGTPDVPEIPDVSELPGAPRTSDVPENPATPEAPDAPGVPEDADAPEAGDAGSTPEIPETPEAPAASTLPDDPRLRVIDMPGVTLGSMRNAALEAAEGEFVHFIDDTDCVLGCAYAPVIDAARRHGADVACCAGALFDTSRGCHVDDPHVTLSSLGAADFNRLSSCADPRIVHRMSLECAFTLYRRALLADCGICFADRDVAISAPFHLAAIANTSRTLVVRDRLVCRDIAGDGERARFDQDHLDDHFAALDDIVSRLDSDDIDEAIALRICHRAAADTGDLVRRTCTDQAAASRVEQLVDAYDGPWPHILVSCHRDAMREIRSGRAVAPRKAVPLVHARQDDPRVTVVVPLLGTPEGLHETLHSLCVQKLDSVEVVCVAGGGAVPDDLCHVYDEYAALDARLRLVGQHEDDAPEGAIDAGGADGAADAGDPEVATETDALQGATGTGGADAERHAAVLNCGLDCVRGEFVCFVECGDAVRPTMLLEMSSKAMRDKLDVVMSDTCRVDDICGGRRERRRSAFDDLSWYGRVFCPRDEPDCFFADVDVHAALYRTSLLRRHGIRAGGSQMAPAFGRPLFALWFGALAHAAGAMFVRRPFLVHREAVPVFGGMPTIGGMPACAAGKPVAGEPAAGRALVDGVPASPDVVDCADDASAGVLERVWWALAARGCLESWKRVGADPDDRREFLRVVKEGFAGPLARGCVERAWAGEDAWGWLADVGEFPAGPLADVQVSVVVPVFNNAPWLRQMLAGVLAGHDLALEVICVDDGSTDDSPAILADIARDDPRVIVITQENAGAGPARNAGLERASGEFICFLDSDDFFEADMLRTMYASARRWESDIVVCASDAYVDETGEFQPLEYTIDYDNLPAPQGFAGADISMDIFRTFVGWPWDKLFRTSFVRERNLTFPALHNSEDLVFVFPAILAARNISVVGEVLAHHRKASGTLESTRSDNWGCFFEALRMLKDRMVEWGIFEEREQDFVNYCAHFCLWHLCTLEGEAFHELYDALVDGWLSELGVLNHDESYYYNPYDLRQPMRLVDGTPEEFLFWKWGRSRDANARLQRELAEAARDAAEQSRRAAERTGEQRATIQRQAEDISRLRTRCAAQQGDIERLETKMRELHESRVWKAGLVVTWPARKLKSLLDRLRKGGRD